MEKVVRELGDIVFKAQKSGAPVVVQPADTDARIAEQASRIADLEQSLTRLNGSLEAATHELDQARRDNGAPTSQPKAPSDRLTAFEHKTADAAAPARPPPPPEPTPPTAEPAAAADQAS